jgi:hypothetical protein
MRILCRFLYVIKVQISVTGIEIFYNNCGQGPAIGVRWKPILNSIKLKKISPNARICKSNDLSTKYFSLKREYSPDQLELKSYHINF